MKKNILIAFLSIAVISVIGDDMFTSSPTPVICYNGPGEEVAGDVDTAFFQVDLYENDTLWISCKETVQY